MSVPKTMGLANRSTSLRLRPKLASSRSTCAFSPALVMAVVGGVKLPPLNLSVVTPIMADSAWVRGVTPSEAGVPPPMFAATDNSTWPAGKGMAVPVRSS